jgi:NADH dehydrogenase [ubiquinone] 1 alpha subcomplex assembly factor 5|eukprot:g6388.t1
MSTKAMRVFNRSLKRLQRDAAATVRLNDGRDFDYLRDEVADRLVSRLDFINRKFGSALDVGSFSGHVYRSLNEYKNVYEIEKLVQCDISEKMLDLGKQRNGTAESPDAIATEYVQADEEISLPFDSGSFDLAISSLNLHWVNDLPGALKEINRCLRPDGVFVGSILGGETLKELRSSLLLAEQEREGGVSTHVSPMAHVGDIGQLMQTAGFAIPTIDTDIITIEYPDAFVLMEHLQGMGENNAVLTRREHVSRDTMLAAASVYQSLYGNEDGSVPATFQIIYMIGWSPDPSQPKADCRGSGKLSLKDIDGAKVRSETTTALANEKPLPPSGPLYTPTTLTEDD